VEQVHDLVESHIQGAALGFIGQERVNVLELNLALEQLASGG
jgi:K+-transporting ATPase ATPase C chain